jgi:hypothetical protein
MLGNTARLAVRFKNRKFNKMMIPSTQRVLVMPIKQMAMSEIIGEQQGNNSERLDEPRTLI